jgi:glycosyltransferase involved in cell wall biosynthesis
MTKRLAIAVLTKNSSKTLEACLQSAQFAQELLVLDDHSSDQTVAMAKKFGASVFASQTNSFAAKREEVLAKVNAPWLFYLDADEQITPSLAKELATITQNEPKREEGEPVSAYVVTRENHFLGRKMYPDAVHRLFYVPNLKGWYGAVHETPRFEGAQGQLSSTLIHHTHTDITSMLEKTNFFSEHEARLRLEANHPPVVWWRLIRIAFTFFVGNYFGKKLYRYGRQGLFESYFQMVDKLIVYVKLWALQHPPKSKKGQSTI